jgi:cell division protein FtsW
VTTGTRSSTRAAPKAPAREPARQAVLQRPLASYHVLLTTTLLLVGIGIVMVFSAASVRDYADTGSSFSTASKQAVFVGLGLPLMWLASRMPVSFWRALAYPALLGALLLLVVVLVPGIGHRVNGAQSWIPIGGGFNLQPAELAKLAVVLWGADLLVRKKKLLREWKHMAMPLLPVGGLVLGLVLLQPDLGTAVVIAAAVVGLLWVVGAPLRYLGALMGALLGIGVLLALSSPHRVERLMSFRDPFADAGDTGYQAVQGLYALSSGGWFGVGLGASREKWTGGLPEAHTDFVFAIIGEELGLLGTLTVLLLFATLVYAGVRIAQRATDPFVRLAASGVTAWIGCQAVINIGAVVGMLPITGLPLPLVSYGGSALLITLLGLGMLLSFARVEPGAPQALAARRGRGPLQRLLHPRAAVGVPAQRTPSRRPVSRTR